MGKISKRIVAKFPISTHYSVANRKAWKRNLYWLFLVWMLVLALCAVALYFGSVTWDPQTQEAPVAHPEYWWQYLLLALGAIIALGSSVLYWWYCFIQIKGFYKTQEQYFKTEQFKSKQKEVLASDLSKLKKSDLKWYKKLGYIDSATKRQASEASKAWIKQCKADNKKIVYAKPIA